MLKTFKVHRIASLAGMIWVGISPGPTTFGSVDGKNVVTGFILGLARETGALTFKPDYGATL